MFVVNPCYATVPALEAVSKLHPSKLRQWSSYLQPSVVFLILIASINLQPPPSTLLERRPPQLPVLPMRHGNRFRLLVWKPVLPLQALVASKHGQTRTTRMARFPPFHIASSIWFRPQCYQIVVPLARRQEQFQHGPPRALRPPTLVPPWQPD